MKKLLLVCAAQLFGFGIMAQTDTIKHTTFYSIEYNWSPKLPNSISFEIGKWGVMSKNTFGITYDFIPASRVVINGKDTLKNISYYTQWVGFKTRVTLYNESKFRCAAYFAPKICINSEQGMDKEMIEFGFNSYFEISKNVMFVATIGDRYISNKNSHIIVNGGFTFIFPKSTFN